MDASVLYDLFDLTGIGGLLVCIGFIALFVHELTGRLTAPMTNRRSRELGHTPARQQRRTVSWLWAWPVPGATAVVTAIVTVRLTTPITEVRTDSALWLGLLPAVCAVAGAAWSVLVLIRRGRDGAPDAVSRVRTDIPAVLIWLVALVAMVPAALPMLIDAGGRSITDITVMALLLVPCPAWILLRRSNQRLHRKGARFAATQGATQHH